MITDVYLFNKRYPIKMLIIFMFQYFIINYTGGNIGQYEFKKNYTGIINSDAQVATSHIYYF